jgi:hypothetical protein
VSDEGLEQCFLKFFSYKRKIFRQFGIGKFRKFPAKFDNKLSFNLENSFTSPSLIIHPKEKKKRKKPVQMENCIKEN